MYLLNTIFREKTNSGYLYVMYYIHSHVILKAYIIGIYYEKR